MVTAILTGLFATTVGQLILQWHYTYISLVGKTSNRTGIFASTTSTTSVEPGLSALMQGIGQILADALLVST